MPTSLFEGNTITNPFFVAPKSIRKKGVATEVNHAAHEIKEGFTLGCDPEGFIFNKKTGTPVPASMFIPGSKWKPHPVENGAVQVDGMAAEFNIDPANTYEQWEGNISSVIKQLEGFLDKEHEIRWVTSTTFPKDVFDAAPNEHKELGCSPDFDAWTGAVNPPPHLEDIHTRVAGGHIHIGWTKDEDLSDVQHLLNCQDLGKQCDWYLGGWGAVVDTDTVRPSLYGRMGAMRYKPYGMEYRVLSNFWVGNAEFRKIAWNRACTAIANMANIFMPDRVSKQYVDMLRTAIVTHQADPELLHGCKFPILTLNRSYNRW